MAGYGTNLYTVGYRQGFVQPSDYSLTVMQAFKSEKAKYTLQHTLLMNEVLCQKKGETDILDWLVLGKHYSKNGEEEIAFQCFYMAHLQDHERFGTNSNLLFNTIDQAGVV